MVTTIIERADGQIIAHTGVCGITLTGQRLEDGVGFDLLMEVGAGMAPIELVTLVGTFLGQLEEMFDEGFLAQCLGHYASETGKRLIEENGRALYMVRATHKKKKV